MELNIDLPYNYTPRWYQEPLLRALDAGKKRAFWILHRRAGKDITIWNWFIKRAFEQTGLHYYLFPTYAQAEKVIWTGTTNEGKRFLDYIPPELIKNKNDTKMRIELINLVHPDQPGSILQLIGTDNYDSIRGTNPITAVFSEFAYQDPMAWDTIRPILKLNGGIAVFNTTPNGENHAFDLFKFAETSPEWFADLLTINDTNLLTERDMHEERASGMLEEMIQQEYYCSFAAGAVGAYYADLVRDAEARITGGVYDAAKLVYTAWDIGYTDDTVCVFYQKDGQKINIIECMANRKQPTEWYLSELKLRGYRYADHFLPHDAFAKNDQTGKSTVQLFREAGFFPKSVPFVSKQEGIQTVRKIFPRLYFDNEKCQELVRALKNYKREYDPERKVFKKDPLHDWSSHYADAIRYMALSFEEERKPSGKKSYGFKMR